MEYRLFKSEEQNTEDYPWGTDTEVAVFPYESDDTKVGEEDFLWRISIAAIEEEESDLPPYSGYDKVLTVLEGDVVLAHEGERVARLKVREQDSFDGEKRTKAFGKITAYNLTVKKGSQGILEWMDLETEAKKPAPVDFPEYKAMEWCFYCHKGYGIVNHGEESIMVRAGEQLVLCFGDEEAGRLTVMGEGAMVWAQIYHGEAEGPEEISSERGTFKDYLTCIKLANSNFRGGRRLWRSLRNVWYDEALQKGIRRVERFYFPFIAAILGFSIFTLAGWQLGGKAAVISAIVIWLIAHIFLIGPLIYFLSVPKPVQAHMKDIDNLTPYEQKVYERQKKENPRLERLLKKYTISGRNKYID